MASDFEIAQMEMQAANATDFNVRLATHLNLGDLRKSRNETTLARAAYLTAIHIAHDERLKSRRESDLHRYATATIHAGLAQAKLGDREKAFPLLEEAMRYASDEHKIWNVYASATGVLGLGVKSISASRNAIAIVEKLKPTMSNQLDLTIYRFSLALAYIANEQREEAEPLLEQVIATLRTPLFDPLRKEVARREAFEIYSTVQSNASAYLSLMNRAQLQLAFLYEERNENAKARKIYRDVLAGRSDDPQALAALARLAESSEEQGRSFAEAFDANPFLVPLIRDYRKWLQQNQPPLTEGDSTGARMRRALEQMHRGEHRAARATLDAVAAKFAANDAVQWVSALNDIALGDVDRARRRTVREQELRREVQNRLAETTGPRAPAFLTSGASTATPTPQELRQLMAIYAQLTPEQRIALDRITFKNEVLFRVSSGAATDSAADRPDTSVFESGLIEGIPFRFSEPTAFAGTFGAAPRLTYRILGVTEHAGADALLLEPLQLEAGR